MKPNETNTTNPSNSIVVLFLLILRLLSPVHQDLVSGDSDRPAHKRSFLVVPVVVFHDGHGHLLEDVVRVLEVRDHGGDEPRNRRVGLGPEDRDLLSLFSVGSIHRVVRTHRPPARPAKP